MKSYVCLYGCETCKHSERRQNKTDFYLTVELQKDGTDWSRRQKLQSGESPRKYKEEKCTERYITQKKKGNTT